MQIYHKHQFLNSDLSQKCENLVHELQLEETQKERNYD